MSTTTSAPTTTFSSGISSHPPTPSSPSSEATIRQLHPNVTIFSRPFVRAGAHVGVRMTAVKLQSGEVLVYNPTELDDFTKRTLASIGNISFIIAPSLVHHVSLDSYAVAYPSAKVIGPDGLAEKHKQITFYRELKDYGDTGDITGANGSLDPTVELAYLPDIQHKEILLFHKPSKIMCCADLIWNLPAREQYQNSHLQEKERHGIMTSVMDHLQPETGLHHALTYVMTKATPGLKDQLHRVINVWAPQQLVPEHGDVISSGAVERIKHAFGWTSVINEKVTSTSA